MTQPNRGILLAEDNPADVYLVREALKLHGITSALHVVEDGEKAVDFVRRVEVDEQKACPDLLLLDLNLPRKTGEDVLIRVRQSPRCRHMPVIILTSSDSPRDRTETARLGANRYFRKPTTFDDFMDLGRVVREVLTSSEHSKDTRQSE